MNKYSFLFSFLLIKIVAFGQITTTSPKYNSLIKKADNFNHLKNYRVSANTYTQAFKLNKWKVPSSDRFNAACVWALADIPDSAFYNLNYIAANDSYSRLDQVTSEHDLISLHNDKRWKKLIETVKQNQDKKEANLNKPLIKELEEIAKDDQTYRKQIKETKTNYGMDSKQMHDLWKIINEKDSINTLKVQTILNTYGWLGPDIIGEDGNRAMFLVIQHSHLDVQEKYLPMMRNAVKNGNAEAYDLALLEDRVAMRNGKKQIYGSQITTDPKTGKDTLYPIEDFANVDKRRADVGLDPLEEYVSQWGIIYKKQKKIPTNIKTASNDFATAIEIHDSIVGPINVKDGFGYQQDFHIDNDMKEQNSAWFKFTIDHDTLLTFDLVPNYAQDDYDFILFKCSETNCINKIISRAIKPDRYCFSINYDKYGSTGLSEYVSPTHVGAGNGVGYVSAIHVKAGETYYLMVNWPYRWHSQGFTIYFYDLWPNKPKGFGTKKPVPIVLENVLFETNKTTLLKESTLALDKLVIQLNAKKTMKIEIHGHTDNTGNEDINQKLSEQRAKSIVEYLVSKNIDKNRLSYIGYGSKKPIVSNDTEEGRKKNRRVEFIVLPK